MELNISINRQFPGEKLTLGDSRWASFNGSFQPETHTPESLLEEVKLGHAICAVLGSCQRVHCGKWCCAERRKSNDPSHCGRPAGYRASWHFVSTQVLSLDFDHGNLGLEDLLANPFIGAFATFIYSTISYTPDAKKWRVIFVLEESITDPLVYCQAQTALLARFHNSDQSIKDPARFFYGSNPETCISHYLGNVLPVTLVQDLVEEFTSVRRQSDDELERRSLPEIAPGQVKGRTASEKYVNRAAQEELAWLESRTEGTGERHLGLLTVSRRLESLRLSPWLDTEAREGIDVTALVLGAAERNGYVAKYGGDDALRAIAWGIGVAEARPEPPNWTPQSQKPDEEELAQARELLEGLADHVKDDPGWVFKEDVAAALRLVYLYDLECWARVKPVLTKIGALRDLQRRWSQLSPSDGSEPQTGDGLEKPERGELTKPLADTILDQEGNYFAQDAGGKLYRFINGVYRRGGEESIRRRVKVLLLEWDQADEWSTYRADEVVEFVRVDAPQLWDRPPEDTINVANGLLDIASRELHPHSPDFLSLVQIPVTYDPEAVCPAIDEFIAQVFPEDGSALAYELPGVCLVPGEGQEKAILFYGPGGNGKSRFLTMLRSFLSKGNSSALSLHRLESERFSVVRLLGKLANICPDLPSEHLAGTSVFKAITGQDTVTAEYKFRESFEFDPFARLIFSANHLPRSADGSEGFFDRWLVVPFIRVFRGTEKEIPVKEMDARLSAPQELSGLLNKALDGLEHFRANGHRFTIGESMRNASQEFRQITDPLAVWLEANTVELPDSFVQKSALFHEYNAAARREGYSVVTETAFGIALKKLRPYLREGQRTIGGKRQRVWLRLGLKTQADEPGAARGAQGSRGFPNFNFSGEKEIQRPPPRSNGSLEKQYRGNPVNPVHPVQMGLSSTPQGTGPVCGVDAASGESARLRSDPWDSFLTEAEK